MSAPGSVTRWIDGLRTGESVAARELWEAYFHRLVELARKRLRALPRRAADEEDVALSAFDSFCRGAEQGRFPRLDDRRDLWQVLLVLTQRKAADLAQHEGREKRDWRRAELIESACPPGAAPVAREPDPAFAAQLAEEYQRLLDALGDDGLRLLAVRKMEGYTNEEIAGQLNCALCTVERRLRRIRNEWKAQAGNGA
jgi:DNA-directed RNA polymerase specialized sigma24 family protein